MSAIKFLNYNVREINFIKNDQFKVDKINLDMKFFKNCTYLDQNKVRLNLSVKIFEDAVSKNYPFDLSLVVSGLFEYNNLDIEDDEARDVLEDKLLEVLFPYVRSVVSSITMTTNLPPLLLPTINIKNFIKKDQSN